MTDNIQELNEHGNGSEIAVEFTPGVTGTLDSVEVPVVGWGTGSTSQYFFDLDSDAGGEPGTVLASLATPAFLGDGSSPLETMTSTIHSELTAGTNYWLVLTGSDDGGHPASWNVNNQGLTGFDTLYSPNWAPLTDTTPAFEVLGTPDIVAAPEPVSILLMLSVAAMTMVSIRKTRSRKA